MKERLIKLMQAEHLTAARLADITNVQPSTVSHIIAGRNNPRYDFLAAIMKNFPNVNSRWLLLGEGDIYEENGNKESDRERPVALPQEQVKSFEPRAEMPVLQQEQKKDFAPRAEMPVQQEQKKDFAPRAEMPVQQEQKKGFAPRAETPVQRDPELDLTPITGSITELHDQPIATQEPHNQLVMQSEPRNQPSVMQSEPHNQPTATQEPRNQHIAQPEQSSASLGVCNTNITSELSRQSEVKTPLPEAKKAAKIVIFNTDGTFEIYQN